MNDKATYKLTLKQIKDIYAFKKDKGKYFDENSTKKVSASSVGILFGVSHTTVINIWNDKYKFDKDDVMTVNTLDTQILKKLIPLFIEVANGNSTPTFPELTEEEQNRIGGFVNE